MFSKQRQFVPKTLPKPKVKVRSVPVESTTTTTTSSSSSTNQPRKPLNGTSTRASPAPNRSAHAPSRPSSTLKRTASGRPRASNSPLALSSADERPAAAAASSSYLAPHAHHGAALSYSSARSSSSNKRIRSPATDSERGTRITFEASSDEDDSADDDWESRLKRRRHMARTDPARRLRSAALTDLAERGYKEDGAGSNAARALRFIHAAELVSFAQGDAKIFPKDSPEELCVELQYPGSLIRERFELAKHRDKLDPVNDIIRVAKNVLGPETEKEKEKENEAFTFVTDNSVKAELKTIIRQLERNSNDQILDLPAFKNALNNYNKTVLGQLRSGAILKAVDDQHIPSNSLVSLVLNQVYDRVVTPQVDELRKYKNGTDNVYGEMNHNFVAKILCDDLKMTSGQVFVDLGSGVGNVVLQAALQIGCESWGWEMMPLPSKLAKQQLKEFKARCKLWGIQPGKARVVEGNFTTDPEIGAVLKRADVVLANNQAFTPALNDQLKIMFLDLKEGCKIVSLKKFTTSSKHQTNDIANSILTPAEHYRWPGNGVSWTEEVGDYYISTKKEGDTS